MTADRKIFSGFIGGIGMSLVNICVSFLQLKLFLKYLPSNIVGIWILFVTFGSYVVFFDLGLSPTLGREISFTIVDPKLSEHQRSHKISTLVRSCTFAACRIAVVVWVVGVFFGWRYLATIVPSEMQAQIGFSWVIFMAGAAVVLTGEGWFAGIYGTGQISKEKAVRSVGLISGLLLMSCSMYLGFGIRGLSTAWLLQSIITVLLARTILGRSVVGIYTNGTINVETLRHLLVPSLRYAATLLGGILILQTDNLVIASVLGPTLIPPYQAVLKIVTTLMSLSMMLVVTSSPFISQAYSLGNMKEIRRLLTRNLRFSLSIVVTLGACISCFADRIISIWLGPTHFIGFNVVWLLLVMILLEAHHLAMATATMATGRIVFVWPALIAGVTNILLSISLANRLGVVGVALGTLCAQMMTNNWYVPYYTMRLFKMSFLKHLREVIAPIIFLLLSALFIGFIVRVYTSSLSALVSVLVGCFAVFIVNGLIFSFIVLSHSERIRLKIKTFAIVHKSILHYTKYN